MPFENKHKILIIIPAYNEEKNIGKVIDSIMSTCKNIDIVVVNDGSCDDTQKVVKNKKTSVLNHIFNLGVGASFQTACKYALMKKYEYVVRLDGDGQHDPRFIKNLLEPLLKREADIAIGSRFLGNSGYKTTGFRLIGIYVIAKLLSLVTKNIVTDPTSGYCAMNKRAFKFFAENCVEDFPEPEIIVHHKNFKIKEVPISISERNTGKSRITPLKSIYYMVKVTLSILMSKLK